MKRYLSVLAVTLSLGALHCADDGEKSFNSQSSNLEQGADCDPSDPNCSRPACAHSDALGLWKISGSDSRGPYTGQAQVYQAGAETRFIRDIRYSDPLRVESDRRLAWVFTGIFKAPELKFHLAVSRFIHQRDGLKRTTADSAGLDIIGTLKQREDCAFMAAWSIKNSSWNEIWSDWQESPAQPIFAGLKVTKTPMHNEPDQATKSALFAGLQSYFQLPAVRPYVDRPEFKKAVHFRVTDLTDADYYQRNPDTLRIVQAIVDPISIQETLSRANAYRYSLTRKTAIADQLQLKFILPDVGAIPYAISKTGNMYQPSGDGALWTGEYVASQFYRYEVTREEQALKNAILSLDSMLKLVEITGDNRQFARTLRRAVPNNTEPNWKRGVGVFAGLDWLAGGNNDMIKGLFLSYAVGYRMLCLSGDQRYTSICARIRFNSKSLTDNVPVAGERTNLLLSNWLVFATTTSLSEQFRYGAKASAAWSIAQPLIEDMGQFSTYQAQADYSGLNLNFVTYQLMFELQALKVLPSLGTGPTSTLRSAICRFDRSLSRLKQPHFNIMAAAYCGRATASPDAVSILREVPIPKLGFDFDHTINPEFCMSPYPELPWKNDWLTAHREIGLYSYPYFSAVLDDYTFKNNPFEYRFNRNVNEFPASDYLILYWLGRKLGVFTAAM